MTGSTKTDEHDGSHDDRSELCVAAHRLACQTHAGHGTPVATGDPLVSAPSDPAAVVREFWRLMATNDFHSVRRVLSSDFVLEWPQSRERIRGAEDFARMNSEYPSSGRWRFQLNRLVASGDDVVTHVDVTDGTHVAEAISFFTVREGRIAHMVEYWPDPYDAPANRQHLTERIE